MTTFYYKSPTSLTEHLFCLSIAEEEEYSADTATALATKYDCDIVHWTGDLPFSGYPVVEDGALRPATVTELIDEGIRTLADNEVLIDGAIVKLAWNEEVVDGVIVEKVFPTVEPTPLTDEQLAEQVRNLRDERITSCDWIISRHVEQVALGVDTTLTSDEYAAWLTYRQELRDLPSVTGFPWDGGGAETPWPEEPEA